MYKILLLLDTYVVTREMDSWMIYMAGMDLSQ
jgi:hypothetical protein